MVLLTVIPRDRDNPDDCRRVDGGRLFDVSIQFRSPSVSPKKGTLIRTSLNAIDRACNKVGVNTIDSSGSARFPDGPLSSDTAVSNCYGSHDESSGAGQAKLR